MRHLLIAFALALSASAQQQQPSADQLIAMWRSAVMSGDAQQIRALAYDPTRVQVEVQGDKSATFEGEAAHWAGLKKDGLLSYSPHLAGTETPQAGVEVLRLDSELKMQTNSGARTLYEQELLAFALPAGSPPKLVALSRSRVMYVPPLKHLNPHLYDESADAKSEIAHSIAQAKTDHKKTILVFGGNWCYDCHVLDVMFHQPDIASTIQRDYRVVHVDIGRGEKNTDLVQRYKINLDRGVPAIAILDSNGSEIFVDKGGEFEAARSMDPQTVLAFLKKHGAS